MNLHIPRRNEDESHDGPVEPPWDEDEPPPDDQAEDRTEAGYWSRYVTGAQFLLDKEPDPDPIWGDGPEVLWSPGEPCLVTGPVGVGKTTMVGRLTRGRLGLDPQLLGYKITPGQRRALYLACDRPRQIRRNLARMMRPEDRSVLADRLLVWPGPPPTDLAKTPSFLLDMCRKADADTVVVDGLKDVALELSKDDVGAGLNQAFQRCVVEGIEVIGNHHQKKSSNGPKPRSLPDLYGSIWIAAGAGTVILVWADVPGQAVLEVSTLKPAQESVGPLSVLHDFETGDLEIIDAVDLETILSGSLVSAGSDGVTVTELLGWLGRPDNDRNAREKVRRQLRRLEKTGAVESWEAPSTTGGRPEKPYRWVAR